MENREQPQHCRQVSEWGDLMHSKQQSHLRLMFQNINGLPVQLGPKDYSIRSEIQSRELDFFGVVETNINWYQANPSLSLRSRTRGWFDLMHTNYSNNTMIPWNHTYQRGGSATMITGKLVSHITESSKDSCGLGRWCITRLRGMRNRFTTIITAYRPVPSNDPGSTYIQHQTVLVSMGITTDPREQFFIDLRAILSDFIDKGDQIIVMLDANGDIRNGEVFDLFQSMQLTEIISFRHGDYGPSTMLRNQRRVAIDGIFVSHSLLSICKCGYLDFGDGVIGSDHRAIWVDFPISVILGGPNYINTSFKARRLQANHPSTVHKYLEALHIYLSDMDFDNQMNEILHTIDQDECKWRYEELTRMHLNACRLAEAKCRKLKMGAIPYSPGLSKAIISITLWKKVLRRIEGFKSSLRYIKRLARKVNVIVPLDITKEQAQTFLKQAQNEYFQCVKPTGSKRRDSFLSSTISTCEVEGDVQLASHYRRMFEMEKIRDINRRINYITRSSNNKIQFIIGKNEQGNIIHAESKEDLEQVMSIENRSRFTQAHGTPFLSEPLLSRIGSVGLTSFSDDIIAGNLHEAPHLSVEVRELLNQCKEIKRNDGFNYIDALMQGRIDKGWFRMREKISTSPYGLHVGHLKAIFSSDQISEAHRRWSLLPVVYGFAPSSFCQATNVFIEKKPGLRDVSSLRTIVLYDAVFNMNNKLVAKVVMDRAEELNALAIEQYGSRKSKSASLQTLNKRIIFDCIRQSRRPTIVIGNDMKSAYDRIVHSVASLALRGVGVPKEMVLALLDPLQKMNHHTRTIFGDSHSSFHADDLIFHGVGQGNGAGPMIWAVVSSVIFAAFRTLFGGGLNLPHFASYDIPILSGLAFVDDVDLFVMADSQMSLIDVICEAQSRLTSYESLIKATGGAINPSKSYVYYLAPDHQRNSLVDGTTMISWELPMINCKDHQDNLTDLRLIPAETSQKTLGVHLSPTSNQDSQIQELVSISYRWADYIRTNRFSKKEIMYILESRYFKQIEYSLMSLSLSRLECNRIMIPLLKEALPKMGFIRSLPRVLLFGPSRFQGLQLRNVFTESLNIQLSTLLINMHSNGISRDLIRWSMRCTLYELGFGGPIYKVPHDIFSKLSSPSWYTSLMSNLNQYSITVEDDIINAPLQREGDFYITEHCYNRGFSTRDLIQINNCRLYLGANMASDLVSGCGNYLMDWTWDGVRTAISCSRSILYHRPPEESWRTWRRMLRTVFGPRGRRLHTPAQLGPWFNEKNVAHWYCFTNRNCTTAYLKDSPDSWSMFRINRRFQQGFNVRLNHIIRRISTQEIHEDITPASFHMVRNNPWLSIFVVKTASTPVSFPHRPLYDTVLAYQARAKSPLAEFFVGDQAFQIAEDIRTGVSWGVCDGSYAHDLATSAFCINPSTQDYNSRFVSVSVVPGEKDLLSAYRAELWGIYNFILFVRIIVDAYSLTSGQLAIWCDNLSAVSNCSHRSGDPNSDHYDILASIYYLLDEIPFIKISFRHVYGHQDRTTNELSSQAISNVDMDRLAQDFRVHLQSISFSTFAYPIPITKFNVCVGEYQFSGRLREWLCDHIHGTELKEYWVQKGRLSPESINHIDWRIIHEASMSIFPNRRWTISKLISGFAGVGKWLHRFNSQLSSNCPFCNQVNETTEHVMLCQDDQVKNNWNKNLESLAAWLQEKSPIPSIAIIIPILRWWRDPTMYSFPDIPIDIADVIHSQSHIGWKQFVHGVLTVKWSELVDNTYESASRYSGRRFLKSLVVKLYEISFDMWSFRNAEKHSSEGFFHASIVTRNQAEIRVQFTLGNPHNMDLIRRLLRKGIHHMLKAPIRVQNLWLASITSARAQPLNREEIHQQSIRQMQSTFRKWLRVHKS